MINIQSLDKESIDLLKDEKELLKLDPEKVRSFYSLTGPARKDYIIQLAEAEAERIKIIRKAQAEGVFEVLKAQAEGLKLIGQAISDCPLPEKVVQMATLIASQGVAQALAEGKSTKMFLPQSIGDIFSVLGVSKEIIKKEDNLQNINNE